MSQPIEGLLSEGKIDGRTAAGKAARAAMRPDSVRADDAGRNDLRADSVREAEEYARQIEENLEGSGPIGSELDIPPDLAPPGWEYELKAEEVAGKENRHHMLGLHRTGWRPVPAGRHPHLMPADYDGAIKIKGLVLMEKPTVLIEKARAAEKREALDQLRNSEAKLHEAPPNTGPRDHPLTPVKVNRELMRQVGAETPRGAA